MSKKYILCVQGEGRGHMTQAISVYEMLTEAGHTVSAVVLGSSGNRHAPAFFSERIKAPLIRIETPNFVNDRNNRSILIWQTITKNFAKLPAFIRSMRALSKLVKEHRPDAVINFFDLLTGLYFISYRPKTQLICIAHQYIYFHKDFEFPKGRVADKVAIKLYTRLTAAGSTKNLALSFYNIHTFHKGVVVVPPILRKEVFALSANTGGYFVIYLVNNGYFAEVIEWHRRNPEFEIHCFADHPDALKEQNEFNREKLHVHPISDRHFLEMMSGAKALASTAGFESVCEAMYLGKPVLTVPVSGHYEQFCNSRDAFKTGGTIFSDNFDLSKLADFSSTFDGSKTWFRNWVENARLRIYNEIVSV